MRKQSPMKLDRRKFLKSAAGVTALSLGINVFSPPMFKRRIMAQAPITDKKLIFIFMRGGNDAINTVIPRGDPLYSATLRPTLYLKPEDAIYLDGRAPYALDPSIQSTFAQFHPSLAPLMEVYQAGNVAILNRIGYKNQSQSHFDSQQFYENGTTNPSFEEGMLYRQAAQGLGLSVNHLAALGISGSQMVALKGALPVANSPDLKTFKFAGAVSRTNKFLGDRDPARGILGFYGGPKDYPAKPYRGLVYDTGLAIADVMSTIQGDPRLNPDTYVPENGATYPSNQTIYYKAKQAAMLLKYTPVQVIGMNLGGFDTHTNQGRVTGGQPDLLMQTANVIRALYRDLRSQWQNLVIVTMSEFGRTTYENGSNGTDHGSAILMLAAGGAVKGGFYNMDAASWLPSGQPSAMVQASGRYLRYLTDFRAVFAEIFQKHFADSSATLGQVIPNYASLAAANPAEYKQLGFIA